MDPAVDVWFRTDMIDVVPRVSLLLGVLLTSCDVKEGKFKNHIAYIRYSSFYKESLHLSNSLNIRTNSKINGWLFVETQNLQVLVVS